MNACASERESSWLEFLQRVQPSINEVIYFLSSRIFFVNAPANECNISLLNVTPRVLQAKATKLSTDDTEPLGRWP